MNCTDLRDAIVFIKEKGGKAFRKQVLAHMLRSNRKIDQSDNIISSLSNFNFVEKTDKRGQVLAFQKWVPVVGGDLKSKQDMALTLCTGILSGGKGSPNSTKSKSLEKEELTGTRLILSGLQTLSKPEHGPPSINDLANEIQEKQALAIQLLCALLDVPGERDLYSLGILELQGKQGRKETAAIKFRPDVLRAYQTAIVSRYLSFSIPHIISETFGLDFQTALGKGLTHINADSIRKEMTSFPPVWIRSSEMDSLVAEVTAKWGYSWWAEDERGGGIGLNGNQEMVYVKLDLQPYPLPLSLPYLHH